MIFSGNKYGYGEQLDDQQHICIKSKWESEKSGFCDLADNGAPVVCKRANSQNEFFLLGLYSSSESCSTFPKPAIFQETAGFDEWVQSTIQKERKCLCHRIIPGRQLIAPDMCCLNTPYNSGMKGNGYDDSFFSHLVIYRGLMVKSNINCSIFTGCNFDLGCYNLQN